MKYYKCISMSDKVRQNTLDSLNGRFNSTVTEYTLMDADDNTVIMNADELEKALAEHELEVINLKLNNEGLVEDDDFINHLSKSEPKYKCINVIHNSNGEAELYELKDSCGNIIKMKPADVIKTITLKQTNIENLRYGGVDSIINLDEKPVHNKEWRKNLMTVLGYVYKDNKLYRVILDRAVKVHWQTQMKHFIVDMSAEEYQRYVEHDRIKNVLYDFTVIDEYRQIANISYEDYYKSDIILDNKLEDSLIGDVTLSSYIDISNDYRIHPRFKFFDDRYLRQYDDMIRPDETMLAINESNTEKVLLFTKTKYRLLLKETEPTIIINGYKIDADVEHYMKLLRRARDKAHTQELKAKAIGAKTNQFIMYKELTIDMLFNIDCKLVSKLYKSGEVIVKLVASKNKRKGIPIYSQRLQELPDSVVLAYDTSKARFNIVLILNEGTPVSTFRMVPIRLINIRQSEMLQ